MHDKPFRHVRLTPRIRGIYDGRSCKANSIASNLHSHVDEVAMSSELHPPEFVLHNMYFSRDETPGCEYALAYTRPVEIVTSEN